MPVDKPKISIIDYGIGNLHSLMKAFRYFTNTVEITEDPKAIKSSSAVVLPGVGSFSAGMEGLKIRNLTNTIKEFADSGRPMLGICLGAQIMLSKGYEFGEFEGLDIIQGEVVKFPRLPEGVKIPQIGWNKIYSPESGSWKNTILNSTPKNSSVYFVHSYILQPSNQENVLALSNYGGQKFCSAIKQNNIYGCQFHPEKSGEIGLTIIKKFINLIK